MPDIIKERSKEIVAAKKQVLEGRTVLWNSRLEAMANIGDVQGVLDVLGSAVEDNINNCGCNVQCGAMQGGGQFTNPVVR